MCFAKYLRDDLLVWMENIGPFRGNDIFEAQNTNTSPRHSLSSTDLRDEAAARIEPQNYPNDDPHFKAQNDDVHQRSPSTRIEKPSPKFNTYYLNLGLSSQIHTLQQDVVGLLRCEDRASKTIREMEEDAKTRKKTTDQAEAEMQHQINEYKHQIEAAEQDKIRVANENANAISAHEDRLREVKNEMEVQRQAAERRSTEVENKHTEDMSAANKKITELQNKQTITINSQRDFDDLRQQLSEAGKRKAEELSAKDLEIATLKTAINDRDAEICRLGTDTESAGEARRTLIREKNDLAHALAGVQRRVDRLGTENGRLVSERENIESKAANAEGRARGFQDQLKAVRTRAEQSERLHQEAVEDARDKVLSAYAISTAQEDPQTTTTTANEEQRLSALVEQLRNENRELRKEQEAALDDRDREWEKICDDHETELSLWYEAKQKKAIENERANCQATSGADAREHAIHQECEEEKQQALAAERLLLLEQFQAQFQIEILNYKTRIDSERADTRIQAEAHNNTNPMDQVLLNEEIKKRDDSIILHQKNVTDALATNRELETTLALIKAENERLSLAVTTYESRNTLAQQTQNEAQISLMVRELSRALKLFAEISAVGLDEKHRILLNELVLANKVVTDIRTTIEDGSAIVDYDSFQGGLDRIMADSDPYDALDPRERPALHAQLTDTYTVIGGLSNILAGERGESTKWNILERIYRDNIKGKGKEGAGSGLSAASSSSSSGNGGALNTNHQTGFSDTSSLNSTSNLSTYSSTAPTTNAGESQDEPEWIDSATAHAKLTSADFDPDAFRFEDFKIEDIDFDSPEWRDYDPSAAVAAIRQTYL